jgi:hypothetical protein
MLQTVIQLSVQSRTTSYSISFQPRKSSSIKTCGEYENASFNAFFNSFLLFAKPEPNPPRANPALNITETYCFAAFIPSSASYSNRFWSFTFIY